jgi:hypothetical protein
MATTIMILYVFKLNKIIHFPDFDKKIPGKVCVERLINKIKTKTQQINEKSKQTKAKRT